ncbi:ATPase, T2SS/T4P/T4SS family (plasmid) [Dyella sp. BiH032]|uniref:ATPase, T2SS/T4P/T4SS family n=1 Tax=Dyella sp. BiH032 TaxID=3075430 RepID=UPI00289306F4|nr:ATPase, T2SS/T4P/T4SS family [Dyella sp. BiH032]WNL48550.1 ATPase, T2SS/T4P/T4SS family [Dyella sp. BiH032]
MAKLRDLPLTDLYIGSDHIEYRDKPGAHAPRLVVPEEYRADIEAVRAKCNELFRDHRRYEFALPYDGVLYRVGVMDDVTFEPIFVLNRTPDELPPFDALGLPQYIERLLADPSARGLVVFAGDQRQGKTTSATVSLVYRMVEVGTDALALQDPIECNIGGMHGNYRLYLQPVDGVTGYAKASQRAMRFGMTTILYGEIRRGDHGGRSNAAPALDLAEAGCFILATTHGSTIVDTLTRLVEMTSESMTDANAARAALSKALAAVVWQELERFSRPDGSQGIRVHTQVLDVTDPQDADAIRATIKSGNFSQLPTLIQSQANRKLWSSNVL